MIQFRSLLEAGARVAVMSGVAEGDCGIREAARDTRARFHFDAGLDARNVMSVRQVHGATIIAVDESPAAVEEPSGARTLGEADGLVTDVPGVALSISVADCVPVLMVCGGPKAIGAFHSGRAGTLLNIAGKGVGMLRDVYSCEPACIHVALGPCISGAHYEVSEGMADEFRAAGYEVKGRYLDLPGIIREQLIAAGVPAEHVAMPTSCTFEDADFYSYRRGDLKERNAAVLML